MPLRTNDCSHKGPQLWILSRWIMHTFRWTLQRKSLDGSRWLDFSYFLFIFLPTDPFCQRVNDVQSSRNQLLTQGSWGCFDLKAGRIVVLMSACGFGARARVVVDTQFNCKVLVWADFRRSWNSCWPARGFDGKPAAGPGQQCWIVKCYFQAHHFQAFPLWYRGCDPSSSVCYSAVAVLGVEVGDSKYNGHAAAANGAAAIGCAAAEFRADKLGQLL